jgi:XTP/dITP diphosphohydrolase
VAALKVALASSNPDKLAELRVALPDWELDAMAGLDYPEETGETFEENARLKAEFGRTAAPGEAWVLGEDSGIEVAALGGRPGVHSARWAAGDPVGKLLAALDGHDDRRARYVSALVLFSPDAEEVSGIGALEGTIATEPRGDEGFGYDPVFVPRGHDRTVAELGNDWKRANSHRARAVAALREAL